MEPDTIKAEQKATLFSAISNLENMVGAAESAIRGNPPVEQTVGEPKPMPESLIIAARNRIDELTVRVSVLAKQLSDLG